MKRYHSVTQSAGSASTTRRENVSSVRVGQSTTVEDNLIGLRGHSKVNLFIRILIFHQYIFFRLDDSCECNSQNQDIGSVECASEELLSPPSKKCRVGYYFDPYFGGCEECESECLRCNRYSSNCTSCDRSQRLVLNDLNECVCEEGYVASLSGGKTCELVQKDLYESVKMTILVGSAVSLPSLLVLISIGRALPVVQIFDQM